MWELSGARGESGSLPAARCRCLRRGCRAAPADDGRCAPEESVFWGRNIRSVISAPRCADLRSPSGVCANTLYVKVQRDRRVSLGQSRASATNEFAWGRPGCFGDGGRGAGNWPLTPPRSVGKVRASRCSEERSRVDSGETGLRAVATVSAACRGDGDAVPCGRGWAIGCWRSERV